MCVVLSYSRGKRRDGAWHWFRRIAAVPVWAVHLACAQDFPADDKEQVAVALLTIGEQRYGGLGNHLA